MNAFQLDRAGVGAILKGGDVAGLVARVTAGVAASVSTPKPAEVVTRQGTTDRAVGQVIVADGRALKWQAENGVLTRAAAANGLQVRQR